MVIMTDAVYLSPTYRSRSQQSIAARSQSSQDSRHGSGKASSLGRHTSSPRAPRSRARGASERSTELSTFHGEHHDTLSRRQSYLNDADRHPPSTSESINFVTSTGHDPGASKRLQNEHRARESADNRSTGTTGTETVYLEPQDLGILDVAALIINKMIGTGIFTTPGIVLQATGNKNIALSMWLVGGVWTFLSVLVYVEFGATFPFNGGELIYLDESLRKPELLATILFSAYFILIPNTTGNSLAFSKNLLLAENPTATVTEDLNGRLLTFVAICGLSMVCFLHYFSRRSGMFLNKLFALYKIFLLIAFIVAGGIASRSDGNGKDDWSSQPGNRDYLGALIYVMYSYRGWENANYVSGELKIAKHDLKVGAVLAVLLVTILYTLVTMAYFLATPYVDLAVSELSIVVTFAPKAFNTNGPGIKVCIALSALGNLIAVVYTSSKVKQQIARQCIIPFYRFFASTDKQFKTPLGALILHWFFAVIWIALCPNTTSGYGFLIGVFVYAQLIVGVFVAYGLLILHKIAPKENDEPWKPVLLKFWWMRLLAALPFAVINFMALVQSARAGGTPPRYMWPVVVFAVEFFGLIYWAILTLLAYISTPESSIYIHIITQETDAIDDAERVAFCNAVAENNSRTIVYRLRNRPKRIVDWLQKIGHRVARYLH